MRKHQLEKELHDNARLLRAWRQWHREQLEAALGGPHGVAIAKVIDFLKRMDPHSAPALIALLHAHDWDQVAHDVRYVLLHEINSAIARFRERSGLPPIDDPLPGQRANAFLLVKDHLFPHKRGSPPDGSGK
jgi:hypothetical protein